MCHLYGGIYFERDPMKIVKVSEEFFADCKRHDTASELMVSASGRPCVLLLNLMYRGRNHKFVVPFRSNISQSTPDDQYFHLPPNKSTRARCSHGIHYIKLFPVTDKYIQKYRINGDTYLELIQNIVDEKESIIVNACQSYLEQCERGNRHFMTPDIDGIMSWLYSD